MERDGHLCDGQRHIDCRVRNVAETDGTRHLPRAERQPLRPCRDRDCEVTAESKSRPIRSHKLYFEAVVAHEQVVQVERDPSSVNVLPEAENLAVYKDIRGSRILLRLMCAT